MGTDLENTAAMLAGVAGFVYLFLLTVIGKNTWQDWHARRHLYLLGAAAAAGCTILAAVTGHLAFAAVCALIAWRRGVLARRAAAVRAALQRLADR